MGSPLLLGKPNQSKNMSDMYKNVLTKNMKDHPGFNQLFANKEPQEETKKQASAESKPVVIGNQATNSPYTASPLRNKPKGSIVDNKKVGMGSPSIAKEDTENVKKILKKME